MEIERKFLVDKEKISMIPLNEKTMKKLEQVYLSIAPNEIRVRKTENPSGEQKCFMTIKSNGALIRQEVEFEISNEVYLTLSESNLHQGAVVKKLRYEVPIGTNLIAEVDFYESNLKGLVIIEVEFQSLEQAEEFEKPEWFGEEVTYMSDYKNKNLARIGLS